MNEADPNGKAASEPGAKLDAGKNRVGLMADGFADALWQVSLVTTFGAAKYTPNGWRSVPNGAERYRDALCRHLLLSRDHATDSQSGLLHLAHMAWNALAILELEIQRMRAEP